MRWRKGTWQCRDRPRRQSWRRQCCLARCAASGHGSGRAGPDRRLVEWVGAGTGNGPEPTGLRDLTERPLTRRRYRQSYGVDSISACAVRFAEVSMEDPPVFLDYDQAALDAAYDQAAYAPNREQLIKRRIRDSARRSRLCGTPSRPPRPSLPLRSRRWQSKSVRLQASRPLRRPPSGTRSSIGHAPTPPPIAAPVGRAL